MSRSNVKPTKLPDLVETPADIAAKHNRVLLHALQTAHPVMYQGKQRFMHTLTCQVYAGGITTTAYLMGDPAPVPPDQIILYEVPQ